MMGTTQKRHSIQRKRPTCEFLHSSTTTALHWKNSAGVTAGLLVSWRGGLPGTTCMLVV